MFAPFAKFDDDWDQFSSFSSVPVLDAGTSQDGVNIDKNTVIENKVDQDTVTAQNNGDFGDFSEPAITGHKSMEDFILSFNENLPSWFRLPKANTDIETFANANKLPVHQNHLWECLVDDYGLVQPLDWKTSHIRRLHTSALGLTFMNDDKLNKSIYQQSESMKATKLAQPKQLCGSIEHNVPAYTNENVYNTHLQDNNNATVIKNAEAFEKLGMTLDIDVTPNATIDCVVQHTTVSHEASFKVDENETYVDAVVYASLVQRLPEGCNDSNFDNMSLSRLKLVHEGLKHQVKLLSTALLKLLNSRDEFQCEYEIKNTLISKVLEVQHKREIFCKVMNSSSISKKFGLLKKGVTSETLVKEGRFLTTVIPYHKNTKLSLDRLIALVKILDAIKADSEEVPSLITSYVSKVTATASTKPLSCR